ncbi:hypothetical protein BABINDRAFT_161499 [Babjeviella inositovora NRRL Y-12698]|uniref:Thioredoxin domain-containing protein n=1 Tax=Babjeviella inositovora NRRL Y-12698 TaxID=984486 RepID=A0A1E3QS92_9ASCO|nr:uncharacterized protein BABINDRAFT_161499 [Babjeviella inositovora NRRL Y-12698]ODQ79807.1 hypothetical protein BABINDRAFT_161499 [Babjeviella inositovora NRRL Y-12698]
MSIPYIKDTKEFDSYLSANNALVVYFTAVWCGPCQAIKPVIEGHYEQYPNVQIAKVDIDQNKEVPARFQVSSVPSFLFFSKGKLTETVRGANPHGIKTALDKLSALHPSAKRSVASAAAPVAPAITSFVPKGFEVLNDFIWFADFQALNSVPLYKGDGDYIKKVFKTNEPKSSLISDADSQLLFHVPFSNISKIYSILIKVKPLAEMNLETADVGDIADLQRPSTIKVWANSPMMSFEDASADAVTPLHVEDISSDNEWYEVKLKYVKFQKVQSLGIFIEGEDEDLHTVVEKIVFVGVNGESKDQGKIQKIEEHDH